MMDKFISYSLTAVFSKPSLVAHTIWFALWFYMGLDVSLLTNIVSLEAIYIGIFVGIQQIEHHENIKDHLNK